MDDGDYMELWLMRHGTTTANLEGRVQGTLDYPLSEIGKKESYLLAQRLKKQTFSLFFSSSLLRLADICYNQFCRNKASVLYSPILREYDFDHSRVYKKEIQRQYPRLFNMLQQDFHHTAIPKAEGLKDCWHG